MFNLWSKVGIYSYLENFRTKLYDGGVSQVASDLTVASLLIPIRCGAKG